MSTTYGQVTYQELIDSLLANVNESDALGSLPKETIQMWILKACQDICSKVDIKEQRVLRILYGVEEYSFADTTTPVTGTGTLTIADQAVAGSTTAGTGTITADGTAITGTGTLFKSECAVGKGLVVGSTYVGEILSIESNTALTLLTDATEDITTTSSYTITTTKFTQEVVEGSVLTVGVNTYTVESVTDPYNIVLTTPASAAVGASAFQIDTKVTELPTRFYSLDRIDYELNGYALQMKVTDIDDLIRTKVGDSVPYYPLYVPYLSYAIPYCCAIDGRLSSKRVLRVYPAPVDNREVTVHAWIRVVPRNHTSDALTAYTPLDQRFEPAMLAYAEYMTYKWLKKFDLAGASLKMYQEEVDNLTRLEVTRTRMEVDPT